MEFALKFVFVFEGGSILGVELVLEAASPLYVTAGANDWTPGKDWQLAGFKQTVPQIQNTKTKNTKQKLLIQKYQNSSCYTAGANDWTRERLVGFKLAQLDVFQVLKQENISKNILC